uniref:Cytochrome b6-f complex subunit 6 n=1 Tax=Equisetum hyemale TaxID=3262 RepID=M9PK61_EQUHY|nr:cytochrome b6-f complex subunit 6 [Equisetum hyemale]YP_010335582.1 cytochrome b6/f subunit L [Equisetum ramosissimum]YP_010466414.1 cytochrome b6-f complex subunit 6 [Equisetum xylochaetum]AGC26646.1 cytochrome b6-f complex subunit 6 [Equisetum hyemale]UNI91888.1 cytochrome b6/f subunit L [Equisetum ramosissimum]UVF28159.1 cytochrome b6-f complex subunit 6 [Equisetum xylochaetum]UVF34900.1 cytochrome b6/f subunit L [Equisetum ramosissimum]WEI29991.1 cytochrome b6/f complex subunit VI [Eq
MITLISYFVLLLAALTLTTFLFITFNKIQLI